jgi:hypothetical protein
MQSQNQPGMSQSWFDKYDKAFSFRGEDEKQPLNEDQHHVSPPKSPLPEFFLTLKAHVSIYASSPRFI